ncbi:MAG: leucyl aminopeptidase [Candidatus Hydrothermarchaeota archaeon]|nr:leucyl aminopeptidase [Candidatus Hydrothermarchaeota archaeon]
MMNLETVNTYEGTHDVHALILGRAITDAFGEEFTGKQNQVLELPTYGKLRAKKLIIVGLGERREFALEGMRQAAGKACVHGIDAGAKGAAILMDSFPLAGVPFEDVAQATVEGAILGTYRFRKYKSGEEVKELDRLVLSPGSREPFSEGEEGARRGKIIAEAVNYVRDIVNSPGNEATPRMLAEEAQKLTGKRISCKIMEKAEIKKLGMGAFLGVAQGSAQPPKFIILDYNPRNNGGTIILVGKAITFDSGGISIKHSTKMDKMKYDKAGGAAILGVIHAASKLHLHQRVVGLIPATENLLSGSALKPGDILTSADGKTIEIINTDAEGRLILADALNYALGYKPKVIVDIATLTGACVIALGNVASGLLGNDEGLKRGLKKAGEATGERVWELPLWKEYEEQIESDVADIKNVGGKDGGAITAASFLNKFVEGSAWAHIDIAGTAWNEKDKPYAPKGATGIGVRLLIEFLRRREGTGGRG